MYPTNKINVPLGHLLSKSELDVVWTTCNCYM